MIKQLANILKIAKQKLDLEEKNLLRNKMLIKRKYADIDSINIHIAHIKARRTQFRHIYLKYMKFRLKLVF